MKSKFISEIFEKIKEYHEANKITHESLKEIEEEFQKSTPYLLAGKSYGSLVEADIISWDENFVKPNKKIDENYKKQAYDIFVLTSGKKIEVKSVRASKKIKGGIKTPFIDKALSSDEEHDFWANFQQVKPALVDFFIFVFDWSDEREIFLVPSGDINPDLPGFQGHQHRGNTGEYQIWMDKENYQYFKDNYFVTKKQLIEKLNTK